MIECALSLKQVTHVSLFLFSCNYNVFVQVISRFFVNISYNVGKDLNLTLEEWTFFETLMELLAVISLNYNNKLVLFITNCCHCCHSDV